LHDAVQRQELAHYHLHLSRPSLILRPSTDLMRSLPAFLLAKTVLSNRTASRRCPLLVAEDASRWAEGKAEEWRAEGFIGSY
jgi:hypothetical protein